MELGTGLLTSEVQQAVGLGPSGRCLLVHHRAGRWRTIPSAAPLDPILATALQESTPLAVEVCTLAGGRRLLLAVAPTRRPAWRLLAMVDEDRALQLGRDAAGTLVTIGLVSLRFSLLVVVAISRQLARPIEHLARSVRAVSKGDLTSRCEISGEDESPRLGSDIDHMTSTLADLLRREQTKVKEQTAELELSRQTLQSALESMPAGVALAGKDGRLWFLDPEAQTSSTGSTVCRETARCARRGKVSKSSMSLFIFTALELMTPSSSWAAAGSCAACSSTRMRAKPSIARSGERRSCETE